MHELREHVRLNRPRVRQWLAVAALSLAFLSGALARNLLAAPPVTATPESGVVSAEVVATVPDAAVAASALNSRLTCQRAAVGSLACTATDPDRIREVQVFDAVSGAKLAKASPTPACATTLDLTVPAASAGQSLYFRIVDCAATAGQPAGRDWYTVGPVVAAAANSPTANASANTVSVSGPRATR